MSQLDTADAPREWIRFSNEPEFDPESYYEEPAEVVDEDLQRLVHRATHWFVGGVLALITLGVISGAGYSLGPGSGGQTVCEAAGGHMIDKVIVHRCAP